MLVYCFEVWLFGFVNLLGLVSLCCGYVVRFVVLLFMVGGDGCLVTEFGGWGLWLLIVFAGFAISSDSLFGVC